MMNGPRALVSANGGCNAYMICRRRATTRLETAKTAHATKSVVVVTNHLPFRLYMENLGSDTQRGRRTRQ